jgi:GT2 family glycosyltransferase
MELHSPVVAKPLGTEPIRVSVVIPTRDRRDAVVRTVRSVLDSDFSAADITVVDQSESDETESAVSGFLQEERFRYIRSNTRGVSAARNIGARGASGSIIANTDDDCEVPSHWLTGVVEAFSAKPEAAIVLGNVVAGPHPATGFVPAYKVKKPLLVRGVSQKYRVEGIGACFAYRADVWRELKGFDELLGAGALFRSAEEVDFMIRALARGHAIYETPDTGVIHHGFRKWEDADRLIENHLYGIGAVSAKHIRLHTGPYLYVLAQLAARWALGSTVVDFGYRPSRLTRVRGFLRGFSAGWTHSVDGGGHFVP